MHYIQSDPQYPNLKFDQNIWNTFARPLIDYYAPLAWKLGSRVFMQLLSISRTSLRNFLGVSKGTPREIVDWLMLYDVREWEFQSSVRWESQFSDYMGGNLSQAPNDGPTYPRHDLSLISKAWLHVSNVYFSRVNCKLCHLHKSLKEPRSRLDSLHLRIHFPDESDFDISNLLREVIQITEQVQRLSMDINWFSSTSAQLIENDVEQTLLACVGERKLALQRWQFLDAKLLGISKLMDKCLLKK